MQTVIQVQESEFRLAGQYTDKALSLIKECKELISNGVMFIRTSVKFDLNVPEIHALNHYLILLRRQGVVAVQIILD
tara:strand:- start:63 stop:293 length:231 start_codon:yes stop_codon:yes gene_type:complete